MASVDSTDLIQLIFREKKQISKNLWNILLQRSDFLWWWYCWKKSCSQFYSIWGTVIFREQPGCSWPGDGMGWQDVTGWHWMTSSERWLLWKLLSWRLDILPAKFRSTADTSENLLSIHPINPCTKTIFGEGTNAVAGEYLGSIRSCHRRQKFSCKQSRGYTAGFAGYRGIWKGHTARK